jgi:hypothetical protein
VVKFYEGDLNAAGTALSNCAAPALATGIYTICTVNGAIAMRFAGYAPNSFINHTRAYAEVPASLSASGATVLQVRGTKPDANSNFSEPKRLNATAWAALKAVLGL